MNDDKKTAAGNAIKSVTNVGIATNICLLATKLAVGFFSGSIALVADGLHSLSDITTDAAVLLGYHFGSKEPDTKHPYGHGRIETFSAGFIAFFLICVGSAMIGYAAIDMAKGKIAKPGMPVLLVAIISVVAKELLYRLTRKVAIKWHSPALYANAWHQRSDALSSVAVVAGFLSIRWFAFEYGDQLAAVAVGLMIILVGVRIAGDCLRELTESAADSSTIEHIKRIIESDSSIHHWHKLRTRTVGREIFLDLHILVEPDLSVTAAHQITENLEKALDEQITRPINITIHIEPDTPELRR